MKIIETGIPDTLTFSLPFRRYDDEAVKDAKRETGFNFWNSLPSEKRKCITFRQVESQFDRNFVGEWSLKPNGEKSEWDDYWKKEEQYRKQEAASKLELTVADMTSIDLAIFIRENPESKKGIAEALARLVCPATPSEIEEYKRSKA